jgi:hypothetical protein
LNDSMLGTGRVGTTAHWPACSDRHAEANRCPGCAGHAHGARRLGLPAILIEAGLEPTSIQVLKNSDAPSKAILATGPRSSIRSYLGLNANASGMNGWDVFDSVLTPGDLILLTSWRIKADAEAFKNKVNLPEGARLRCVRIVRDYGMFDRQEAPQYYPAVERSESGA